MKRIRVEYSDKESLKIRSSLVYSERNKQILLYWSIHYHHNILEMFLRIFIESAFSVHFRDYKNITAKFENILEYNFCGDHFPGIRRISSFVWVI